MKNRANIYAKIIKNVSKWESVAARNRCWKLVRSETPQKSGFLCWKLILGVLWGTPEFRRGAKNGPKNSIRRLFGSLERSKARYFWFSGILFSTSISGHIFNEILEKMASKMMPKSIPKSMKNRCDFGTCDFLFFAKSISLKSFFLHDQGDQKQAKIHQKSMPKRG